MIKKALFFTVFTAVITIAASAQQVSPDNKSATGKVFMPLPGVSEKMNTEDIISKLVFIRRLPIQKKENNNLDIKLENDILKDFSKYLRDLDTKSKGLYDYQNPFGEMVGDSSDKNILEAIAGRKAKKENHKITVFQTAKPDAFMSSSLPRNQVLQAGTFTMTVGTKTYRIKFNGGTLSQLMSNLREAAGEDVDVKIINDTPSTYILVISGKSTGEKNKITFTGDTQVLFDAGILKKGEDKTEDNSVDFTGIVSKNQQPIPSNASSVRAKPGTDGEVNLKSSKILVRDNTTLTFTAKILGYDQMNPTNGDSNSLDIELLEGVTVSNITVAGGSLISTYEENTEPPAVVSNFTEIFTLVFNEGSTKTFFVDADGIYSNFLSTYKGKTIDKIQIKNANTDRDIVIADVKIRSVLEEGGIQPKNSITKACDSIINFNGVEIRRDKNQIEDLIEGVTLNLLNESKVPVNVTIDHNYKKVEDALLAWVDSYNKSMEYLSILTKPNLDRTPLSERSQENLKSGVFQTETSLTLLKNRLRTDASSAYKTDLGRELALLEQIGIYTKKPGSVNTSSEEWDAAKMGLLTAEPEKVQAALRTKFDAISQLFANDTTGDLVKDSGVAYMVNNDLKMVIGSGSFIERRISLNDSKIKENNKEIGELTTKLADYEMDLRRKYGKMNQTISETDSKSKWLNNQIKSQQQQ